MQEWLEVLWRHVLEDCCDMKMQNCLYGPCLNSWFKASEMGGMGSAYYMRDAGLLQYPEWGQGGAQSGWAEPNREAWSCCIVFVSCLHLIDLCVFVFVLENWISIWILAWDSGICCTYLKSRQWFVITTLSLSKQSITSAFAWVPPPVILNLHDMVFYVVWSFKADSTLMRCLYGGNSKSHFLWKSGNRIISIMLYTQSLCIFKKISNQR